MNIPERELRILEEWCRTDPSVWAEAVQDLIAAYRASVRTTKRSLRRARAVARHG